jgi:hypothetical protein
MDIAGSSHPRKPLPGASPTGFAEDYIPRNRAERIAHADYCNIHVEGEDRPAHCFPRKARPRKASITVLIRRARAAGERGIVRVELVNADGTRTIVTSSREAAIDAMTEADAEKLWIERLGRHAH